MPAYNPVDYNSLGDGIASVFMQQPLEPILDFRNEVGSGVYAVYYDGAAKLYAPLKQNYRREEFLKVPIYIGKAMPQSNKGLPPIDDEPRVIQRIRKHAQDYRRVGLADHMHVRYLILSPVWVVLAETHLIRMFQPLWNVLIQGKGSNAQGGNRSSEPSDWDVLHPGRGRDQPARLQQAIAARKTELEQRVKDHLDAYFSDTFPTLKKRVGTGFVRPDPQAEPMAEPDH